MKPRFIHKTYKPVSPIDPNVIDNSIRGIKKLAGRLKRECYRSTNPEYVIPREEKIEKLQLIVIDLKRLL